MPKILLTGFEPFGGCKTNSSMLTLDAIEMDVIKLLLPVTYEGARELLQRKIEEYQPDVVVSMGQAGGDGKVRIEKIGINFQGAAIADNAGVIKSDERISNGPDGILTHIDTKKILDKLKEENIPSYLSLSAGGYICNTVYYTALESMHGNALFVHLPYAKGENEPSMEVSLMKKAMELILKEV